MFGPQVAIFQKIFGIDPNEKIFYVRLMPLGDGTYSPYMNVFMDIKLLSHRICSK